MSDSKEFQAKTLDQAIQDACDYFGTERVKLEIDILEDSKSGIFGLVGARKARVSARLAQFPTAGRSNMREDEAKARKGASAASSVTGAPGTTGATSGSKPAPRGARPKSAPAVKAGRADRVGNVETNKAVGVAENSAQERSQSTRSQGTRSTEPRTTEPRFQVKSPRDSDKRNVASDKPNERTRRHQGSEEYEEEDESQRKFLSKIISHDEEELDDNVLEALDRQAMVKANLLGNMTEAEVRASGQSQDAERKNYRGKNPRAREANPRGRTNDRERGQAPERGEREREDRVERPISERATPATRGLRESRREEDLERKKFYEQKRQQQREANPPREIIVAEYDASPLPRVPLEELDTEKLLALTRETILKLVGHLVGLDAPIEVKIVDDRVHVSIESEDTGLLIGREGQHLAAIQYLASRILTRTMESQIRIQVDTGDYHSRQDSRMEFLAQALAEKAKATGRPQSTRPLSAYQRRVIHLALQEDTEIQTRSCGDGTLKRVIIMRRRGTGGGSRNFAENAEMDNSEDNYSESNMNVDMNEDMNTEFYADEQENTSHEFASDDDTKN